jgi:hypothetical protein
MKESVRDLRAAVDAARVSHVRTREYRDAGDLDAAYEAGQECLRHLEVLRACNDTIEAHTQSADARRAETDAIVRQ